MTKRSSSSRHPRGEVRSTLLAAALAACAPTQAPLARRPLAQPAAAQPAAAQPAATPQVPPDVTHRVELGFLAPSPGHVEAADALAGPVLGLRRFEDACGAWLALRVFPEVRLGGSAPLEPESGARAFEEPEVLLLALPGEARGSECAPATVRVPGAAGQPLEGVAAGDRVALARQPGRKADGPIWRSWDRVVAIGGLSALPALAAALPAPAYAGDSEQWLPVLRMPPAGTPGARGVLGERSRFEHRGEEVIDHAQGLVWQRGFAPRPLPWPVAAWYCEALRLGGRDDWRLPTAEEAHGMLAASANTPFVRGPREALVWTRTDDDGNWVASAADGQLISTHYDDPSPYGSYLARCVRPGEQRATVAVDRFAKVDSELVDALAGLAWKLLDAPALPQAGAAQACASLKPAGAYRLPSLEESLALMGACPAELSLWSDGGEARDRVWTAARDPGARAGVVMRVCNLYASAHAEVLFGEEPPEEAVAATLCVRDAPRATAEPMPPCDGGASPRRVGHELRGGRGGTAHGPFRTLYPSGAAFEEGTYDAGRRHGRYRAWHEHGGLYLEGTYAAGVLEGEISATRPTGVALARGALRGGQPAGPWVMFDRRGEEVEHLNFAGGVPGAGKTASFDPERRTKLDELSTLRGWPHGLARVFDPDSGALLEQEVLVAGIPHGPVTRWSEGGEVTRGMRDLGRDTGEWTTTRRDGSLAARYTWRDGRLEGLYEVFGPDNSPTIRRLYRKGRLAGRFEERAEDGTVRLQVEIDDQGTGTLRHYREADELSSEEVFVAWELHGVSRRYHPGGVLAEELPHRDGKLHGVVVRRRGDGVLESRTEHADGVPHGLHESFGPDGKLLSRGRYVRGKRHGKWTIGWPWAGPFSFDFDGGRVIRGPWDEW